MTPPIWHRQLSVPEERSNERFMFANSHRFSKPNGLMSGPFFANFLALISVPILWASGFDFFALHVLAIWVAVRHTRSIYPSNSFDLLYLTGIFVLLVSITITAMSGLVEFGRIFAAANNLSILVIGYIYFKFASTYSWSRSIKEGNVYRHWMTISVVGIFAASIIADFIWIALGREITFPTVFGALTPASLSGLIGQYREATLVTGNWFLGQTLPRTYLLAAYATGSALVIYMIFLCTIPLINSKLDKLRTSYAVLLILSSVSVLLTLSRASIIAILISICVAAVYFLFGRRALVITAILGALVVVGLMLKPDVISSINETRAGSSSLRLRVYSMSFDAVTSQSPMIGFGVKPRLENLLIPIGSHSTPMSLLVRGGFFAAVPLVLCLLVYPLIWTQQALNKLTLSSQLTPYMALFLSGFIPYASYVLVQDIDAYPIVALCAFTYLGLLKGLASNY